MLTPDTLFRFIARERLDPEMEAVVLKLGLSAVCEAEGDAVGAERYTTEARAALAHKITEAA